MAQCLQMPRGNFASFSLFSLAGFMSLQVGLSIGYTRPSLEKAAWTLCVGNFPSFGQSQVDPKDTEMSRIQSCPLTGAHALPRLHWRISTKRSFGRPQSQLFIIIVPLNAMK